MLKKIIWSMILLAICAGAFACSWASYDTLDGTELMTGRTSDWRRDDNAVLVGFPKGLKVKAFGGENPMEYTSKYASIMVKSGERFFLEGMNEKGLQFSMLFLEQAETGEDDPTAKNVAWNIFGNYVLSNFSTIEEYLKSPTVNIKIDPTEKSLPGLTDRKGGCPYHFAFSDATGDRLIIEQINGKMVMYHNKKYRVMTNDPEYKIQLYMDANDYYPGYNNESINRRARIMYYMKDLDKRNITGKMRVLVNMEGMMQKSASGLDELCCGYDEIYPTIWTIIYDLKDFSCYFKSYKSWTTEYYDFKSFDINGKEMVELKGKIPPARDGIEVNQ